MNGPSTLFLIRSKLPALFGAGQGLRNVVNKRECATCLWMNSMDRKGCVDVAALENPGTLPISVVKPPAVTVLRADFLDLIREEVLQYLNVGRVYTEGGDLISDFVSITAVHRVPIRGNEKSVSRVCEECGRLRYSPRYPWYVLKNSLFEQPLYEPWPLDGLVVDEQLKNRLKKHAWKGTQIVPLPVIQTPRDGLIELPEFRGDM